MPRQSTTADLLAIRVTDRFAPPAEGKYIAYDRLTADYACFLDGQYLGHASTYGDAETRCRDAAYEQLTHTQAETADMEAEAIDVAFALDLDALDRETADLDAYAASWDAYAAEVQTCSSPAVRRSWIECDGVPMESITVEGAKLVRVVGEDVAALEWAGRVLEVSSEDLQALRALLNA